MISTIVLIISLLLILLVAVIVGRAVIQKQQIIGRPPVPVFYFILAKILVLVNLAFLLLKGLNIQVYRIFPPVGFIDFIALAFLITGTVILFFFTVKLNKDLVFGLFSSDNHTLQTTGIYSVSRHPFNGEIADKQQERQGVIISSGAPSGPYPGSTWRYVTCHLSLKKAPILTGAPSKQPNPSHQSHTLHIDSPVLPGMS